MSTLLTRMNTVNNMSAPPKSKVEYEMKQLNKYIVFSPTKLKKLLNCKGNVVNSINKYINNHDDLNKNIKKPMNYIICECVDVKNEDVALKDYDYIYCEDIDLLIIVFSCTIGDLYIPNREISINENKLSRVLLLPLEEVNI